MKVIVGQYVPGNSLIHRFDARAKLLVTFCFVFTVFLANNLLTQLLLLNFVILPLLLAKINLTYIYKGLKPVLLISLLTFLVHIFFTEEGHIIATYKQVHIYDESLKNGIFIALRLLYIFVITSLLTLTTTPMEITDGLERLLSPLKRFKLPVHELALMMSISLRFIPTMVQETERIIKAQSARGASFSSGSLTERIKALLPVIIPLFIGAFKKADDLAVAMEARGYNGSEGRSKYRLSLWQREDTVLLIFMALFTLSLALLKT
jgi:energy-coupling factor transport system permease protein